MEFVQNSVILIFFILCFMILGFFSEGKATFFVSKEIASIAICS